MAKTRSDTFTAGGAIGVHVYRGDELFARGYGGEHHYDRRLGQKRAEQIADALNYAERHPWVGPGPSLDEAGKDQILVRCEGEGLAGALWPAFWREGEWQCVGVGIANSHWLPIEWQLMPPFPERKG